MKSDSRFIMEVLMLTLQKIINAREGCVPTKKADLKRGSDLKRCVHDSTSKKILGPRNVHCLLNETHCTLCEALGLDSKMKACSVHLQGLH